LEKIIFSEYAAAKIDNLSDILLSKGYFSFLEDSINYVNDLESFIFSIPHQKHYLTKRHKYGRYYCRYKPNKHTTYYITFDTMNDVYLVKNINSSHTPQYPRYIKGI